MRRLALSACLVLACAETDSRAEALRRDCDHLCASPACEPGVDIDESSVQRCTDTCSSKVDEAESMSEGCALAYASLIGCLGASSCEALLDYAADPSMSELCREESDALAETCPALQLDFGEGGN